LDQTFSSPRERNAWNNFGWQEANAGIPGPPPPSPGGPGLMDQLAAIDSPQTAGQLAPGMIGNVARWLDPVVDLPINLAGGASNFLAGMFGQPATQYPKTTDSIRDFAKTAGYTAQQLWDVMNTQQPQP